MALEIVYKFHTPLESHLLSKPFFATSHEGWVYEPTFRSNGGDIFLSNLSFFYAGREVLGYDDEFATQRLFHVTYPEGLSYSDLSPSNPPVAIGFCFPYMFDRDQLISNSLFYLLKEEDFPFNGFILGRLYHDGSKWCFSTGCTDFADRYFIDNSLTSLRVAEKPLRGDSYTPFCPHFFLKHYNSVTESSLILLPHVNGDLVTTKVLSSEGVFLEDPVEDNYYALGYRGVVSGDKGLEDSYEIPFEVLGSGETQEEALKACLDPVSGLFNVPIALVKWSLSESEIIHFSKINCLPSSRSSFLIAVLRDSDLAISQNKIAEGYPEPSKNSLVYVVFTNGNLNPAMKLNIRLGSSGGYLRNVIFNDTASNPGLFNPGDVVLFHFDGESYTQLLSTSFQARTIASEDSGRLLTGGEDDGSFGESLPVVSNIDDNSADMAIPNVEAIKNYITEFAFKKIYPPGAIYMTTTPIPDLNDFLGCRWEPWGQGRVPIGVGVGVANSSSGLHAIGIPVAPTISEANTRGGAATHTLTVAEMPSHSHSLVRVHQSSSGYDGLSYFGLRGSGSTGSAGGGGAHNNIQPYVSCYMYKRLA